MRRPNRLAATAVLAASALTVALAPPAAARVSPGDFLAGIHDLSPSTAERFTDRQLVKAAQRNCSLLGRGVPLRRVDALNSKYLSETEAMTLIGLGAAAYCPRYWPDVVDFYDLAAPESPRG